MNAYTSYSLLILCGVCLYAAISHFTVAHFKSRNNVHLCFAFLCLSVVLLVLSQVAMYQAHNQTDFIFALRWNLTFILITFILLAWFIAGFTGIRPKIFLIIITIALAVLLVINQVTPYTIQYREFIGLKQLVLPWGETITEPAGINSISFHIGVTLVLVILGYSMYALATTWRRNRQRTSLAMLVALIIFLIAAIEGIAVRAAAINFIHLGWFGFLAMVIIMSIALNRDTQKRLRDSERRFRLLVEQSPFGIQVFSPDGNTLQVNSAWEKLWESNIENLGHYNILQDQLLTDKGIMPYITKGFSGEATEIPPTDYTPAEANPAVGLQRDHWIRSFIYPIKNEAGSIRDVILMHEDVTKRKQVEDAIRLIAAGVSSSIGEEFFQQLVLNLARVFRADYAFIALQDEHEWTRLNMLAACAKGEITKELNFSLACVPFMQIMKEGPSVYAQDVQKRFPEECLLTDYGIQALIGTPVSANNDQRGLLVVMHSEPIEYFEQAREILDIFAVRIGTELQRQEAEAHIRQLAYQDYLTGLANRAQLHERLIDAIQRTRDNGLLGALLLIDLDHFKTINDALGHDVGDELLRAVAQRIRHACDKDTFLARLGGDEFVALVEMSKHTDEYRFQQDVITMAQEILMQLSNPVQTGERAFTIGASIGIVCFPVDGDNELDILRHADMALYQAKNKGRGNIQLYLPDLETIATNRLQMEAGLRTAIENDELEIHYQPVVNAEGKPIAAEALLRWHHPELGNIPPDTFIPVAEDTGLIHSIGHWVFEQVCAMLKRWFRDGVPFNGHISVNVCPWQFARPGFVSELREIMQKHDLDSRYLMLELTETALLYDLQDTIDKLKALRILGLRIALDDFGTGYSSLAYLRDLPLDQLKIDKVFINELSSSVKRPLVDSMVTIGHHMNLAVVAEGVETAEQHKKLIELGCEYFQGYLFCKPLTSQAFQAWLGGEHNTSQRVTPPSR